MLFETQSTSYSIPLSDEFNVIMLEQVNSALSICDMTAIDTELESIDGVHSIDYNGMFGNSLFLSIQSEHDNDETKMAITKVIEGAQARFHANFQNKPYLVYLDVVRAKTELDAAEQFADRVNGTIEWVEDGEFALRPNGANNYFEHILVDNKNGTFKVFSCN